MPSRQPFLRPRLVGLAAWTLMAVVACTPETSAPGETRAPEETGAGSTTTVSTNVESTTATTAATTTTTTAPLPPPDFTGLEGIHTVQGFASFGASGLGAWERNVPGIQDIRIPSTIDGAEQEVLWLPPSGEWAQPLLVGLHSWSTAYRQHINIPYAMFAQTNGWGFIQPNFRGVNNRPEALGSDLAVQDVIDAIDHAIAQGGVDGERVYVVGLSGGGLMALLLAGRHPDRIAAAAAWVANYDLVEFYEHSRRAGRSYYQHIATACGGNPTTNDAAREECLRRSPIGHLDGARDGGVPVYLGHGISDTLAPPLQSALAFNHLAEEQDRLPDDLLEAISRYRLPESHMGLIETETYFDAGDPEVVYAVQSGPVILVLVEGGHNMVYRPALHWFATAP